MARFKMSIDLPTAVLTALNKKPEEFAREMRLVAAVKWYDEGRLTASLAAEVADLPADEFLAAVAAYGATSHDGDQAEVLQHAGGGISARQAEAAPHESEDHQPAIHVEVFIASRLLAKTQKAFTAAELRERVERLFSDTSPGVGTHISAHCVANSPQNAAIVHNYLWRLGHGLYRPFDLRKDTPDPSRADAESMPRWEDVPDEYKDLLFT